MGLARILLLLLSVFVVLLAQASARPKVPTTAETETRNETATPSFSGQLYEAQRITRFPGDAQVLRDYQLAVHQVLAASQWQAYGALRQQFAATLLPLDGSEVALR